MTGSFPDCRKVVIIAAPHSSAWDVVWGLAAKLGLGLGIEFMGKAELFWGPLGWFLRKLGAIPTDRQNPRGLPAEMAARFAELNTQTEARRVGEEWVSTCSSGWAPDH